MGFNKDSQGTVAKSFEFVSIVQKLKDIRRSPKSLAVKESSATGIAYPYLRTFARTNKN